MYRRSVKLPLVSPYRGSSPDPELRDCNFHFHSYKPHRIISYCTRVARTINKFPTPPCTHALPLSLSLVSSSERSRKWKELVLQLYLIPGKLGEKLKHAQREKERENRVASVISSDPFLTLSCQASLGIDTSDEDMKWWVCVEAGQAPGESPRFSLG